MLMGSWVGAQPKRTRRNPL